VNPKKRRRAPHTRLADGPAARRSGGSSPAGDDQDAPAQGRAGVRASAAQAPAYLVLAATVTLTFLAAMALYVVTLAPSVTFEDSGELIAAAYGLGVPHEPGYPLWTMIAHGFSRLPIGDVAYRVNLMSALCSALAAALVAWVTLLVVDDCVSSGARLPALVPARNLQAAAGRSSSKPRVTPGPPPDARRAWLPVLRGASLWLGAGAALAAGLLAATAETTWGQAIITEVYGLNAALVALLLLLTVCWSRASTSRGRTRLFYAICLVLGLGLAAHDTFVVLLPTLALYAFVIERRLRPSWRQLGMDRAVPRGLAALPLSAARRRSPTAHELGQPQHLDELLAGRDEAPVRHRRALRSQHDADRAVDVGHAARPPVVPGAARAGRRRARPAGSPTPSALLARAGLPHLHVARGHSHRRLPTNTPDAFVNADDRALASVFYIPSYLLLAMLVGLGAWWLASSALARLAPSQAPASAARPGGGRAAGGRRPVADGAPALSPSNGFGRRLPRGLTIALAVVIAAVPPALAAVRAPGISMHRYRFADAYIHNVFTVATPRSLVMVDRDQFGFPLIYAQDVEGRRPDVVVLDQELLRRSWYLQDLEHQHPALIAGSRAQVDAFLAAVRPFETGHAYDGAAIDAAYYAMIKSFVDRYEEAGRNVYFTYQPDPRIVKGYAGESLVAALEARRGDPGRGPAAVAGWLTPLDPSRFDFAHLTDGTVPLDRNVLMIRDWYGHVLAARAQLLEQAGQSSQATTLDALAQRFLATGG
jgi:hypothetical protein